MATGYARPVKGRQFHAVEVDSLDTSYPRVIRSLCGYEPRRWYTPQIDMSDYDIPLCHDCGQAAHLAGVEPGAAFSNA